MLRVPQLFLVHSKLIILVVRNISMRFGFGDRAWFHSLCKGIFDGDRLAHIDAYTFDVEQVIINKLKQNGLRVDLLGTTHLEILYLCAAKVVFGTQYKLLGFVVKAEFSVLLLV